MFIIPIVISIKSIFQSLDSAELCIFNLRDESKWKAMSEDAILSVCAPGACPSWPNLPPLCANTLDIAYASNDLEMELRALVLEHRRVCTDADDLFVCKALLSVYLLEWI